MEKLNVWSGAEKCLAEAEEASARHLAEGAEELFPLPCNAGDAVLYGRPLGNAAGDVVVPRYGPGADGMSRRVRRVPYPMRVGTDEYPLYRYFLAPEGDCPGGEAGS